MAKVINRVMIFTSMAFLSLTSSTWGTMSNTAFSTKKIEATNPLNRIAVRVEEKMVYDILDFHVTSFPGVGTDAVLSCGCRQQDGATLHQIEWLKDEITFYNYQPGRTRNGRGRQVVVFSDKEWLPPSRLSHSEESIVIKDRFDIDEPSLNLTVVSLRLRRVTVEMSGLYECKISIYVDKHKTQERNFMITTSRSATVTVVHHNNKAELPVLEMERKAYNKGNAVNVNCTALGRPSPYLQWKYARKVDDDVLKIQQIGNSKVETYSTSYGTDGTETAKVGLTIDCCDETIYICSALWHIQGEDILMETSVHMVNQGESYWLELVDSLQDDEEAALDEEAKKEAEEEQKRWTMILAISISGFLIGIIMVVCCICLCRGCTRRRRRTRVRRDLRRISLEHSSTRQQRSRSLSRRSTKRRAPAPNSSRLGLMEARTTSAGTGLAGLSDHINGITLS